ncbi:ThuA domain-containing protein [Alicyclobacillus ferrooxydans]|uniref:PalA n=1 Tax=Alicyclobacillus ferrooxydans TaxID=471514 RepID=A0A0P9D6B7_9BACL|nr:ThuA domain-containing protein [Alicyclobacillus ferrooxydans]KPV44930.1 PalA [Alicyclobacillus ferrooxydans]
MKVTVWNEFIHEKESKAIASIYPNGMHAVIADALRSEGHDVKTATLEEPSHGLTDDVLDTTDVLVWWGHVAHDKVSDDIVRKVVKRVWDGMGLIVLHSGHFSKVFKQLMGTSCDLKWREAGEQELLWVVDPTHPIAEGIGSHIRLEHEEMYGEHFDIPAPDELVFISSFTGGEVFRSGCTYKRGRGKIFYFRPGHEEYPTYYHKDVQRVIQNAVRWAQPTVVERPTYGNFPFLESAPRSER